ncbi:uncharacterized protein LOC122405299 isoform X2 [Colletes gigas]|uniref:uncharacterized protein LOC122405299 isoform X2 n=1 Tax=Colletes gigas TaxID=935657 RepID=UPI001C9AEBB2|nr:uncharacterized protein LOC122405299 isoform X2 [Colletes gigas]
MKVSWVLGLAVVLCGLWYAPCAHAAPPTAVGLGLSSLSGLLNPSSIQANLPSLVENLVTTISHFPETIIEFVLSIVRNVFSNINAWLQNAPSTMASLIDPFLAPFSILGSSGGGRPRRWLLSTVTFPIQFVQNRISSIENYVIEWIQTFLMQAIQWSWYFLSTYAIPGLHSALNTIDESVTLPSGIHDMIRTINATYSLLRVLGVFA